MKTTLQTFHYNDQPVTFGIGARQVMVNASEMARPFRKQPSDWMRLKQTEEFIASLSAVRGIPRTQLLRVIRGGNGIQGTFFHEDVALEFARWLSPLFAIWCNDRIKELLQGVMPSASDPRFVLEVLDRLRDGYAEGLVLREENDRLLDTLEAQTHKVEFYDNVHRSRKPDDKRIYRISQIAAELGMTGAELNRVLQEKGIQRRRGHIWVPMPEYEGKGYTRKRTFQNGLDSSGEPLYCTFTVWTPQGRDFILGLFE
uniref:KilA protein n=1 Tax=virus sp. ct5rm7 TaxID=2827298 RepID=A0A8S5RGE7_9VIRU|nr:MAG TPA: KilA protein [virus sp. ct5rm7]